MSWYELRAVRATRDTPCVRFAAWRMERPAASVCCSPRRGRLWQCFIRWRLRTAVWKVHTSSSSSSVESSASLRSKREVSAGRRVSRTQQNNALRVLSPHDPHHSTVSSHCKLSNFRHSRDVFQSRFFKCSGGSLIRRTKFARCM